MGELLKLIINQVWTVVFLPLFNRLDQSDLIFLCIIAAAVGYWGWFWEGYFSSNEWFLWGVFLAIICLIWFITRINTRKQTETPEKPSLIILIGSPEPTKKKKNNLLLLFKIIFPIILITGWIFIAFQIYKIQKFTQQTTGIYIACFDNDLGCAYQNKIIEYIDHVIKTKQLKNVSVKPLPKVIYDNEDDRAKKLGQDGAAALILWGKISKSKSITAYLTVTNISGVLATNAPIGGINHQAELSKFYELPQELETLQKFLAVFLEGYSFYHSNQFAESIRRFDDSKNALSAAASQEGLTPEKAMLASVEFYLANCHYFQSKLATSSEVLKSEQAKALESYQNAISLTSGNGASPFFEPLNNLGLLLIERREFDRAAELLQQAILQCGNNKDDQAFFCAAAKHNLGNVNREQNKYREAMTFYDSAVGDLENNLQSHSEEKYFHQLSYLYQNVAYCFVKIADEQENQEGRENYEKAAQFLDKSRFYLDKSVGDDIPQRLYDNDLIKARIYIPDKKWQGIINLLEPVQDKINNPNAYLILSIAYYCRNSDGDSEKSNVSMSNYSDKVFAENQDEWGKSQDYWEKITDRCH